MDVEAATRALQLLAGQKHALELATSGAPVDDVLRAVAATAQRCCGARARAAVFLRDDSSGGMRVVASAGVSAECGRALAELLPGAASTLEDVLQETGSRRWDAVARTYDVRACWSQPIARADGTACGALVVVRPEPARPMAAEVEALALLARTAALVLEQQRRRDTRREAAGTLRDSAARFQRMADHAPVVTWVTDASGRCTFLSRQWYDITGRAPGEGLGDGWLSAIHPADHGPAERVFLDANARRMPFEIEYRLRGHDGAYRWVLDAANPHFDETGAYLGFVGSVVDITGRRHAEAELVASESRLRTIFDSIDEGYCLCEMVLDERGAPIDYRFLEVNPLFESMTGLADAVGHRAYELLPKLEPHWRETYARVALGGETLRFESGSEAMGRWFDVFATPVPPRGRFAIVFKDVTARRRAERAVQDANRRKDEFLATLSHELRNPLAPIRNAVRVLRSGLAEDAQREWATGVIERQVRSMGLLLDDLLDVTRITRGVLTISRQPVDVAATVEAAIEVARPSMDARHHVLAVDLPREPVIVDGDALRLAQALGNLLTNAAKYTDPGGRVEVRVARDERDVAITVADTGIGLAPESLHAIFEMFSQVETALERSEGGLGIGLALVKGIVELHGGTIAAASAGLGRGSRFTVRLPLAAADRRTARAATDVSEDSRPGGRRVLVADDNRDGALTLGTVLELEGYEVRVVHDGAAALEAAREFRPHVALVDIGMPKLDGYEVARALRREPWAAGIKLIALTGWGRDDDRRLALEAGFDHHLAKPADPDELRRLL